MLSVTPGHGVEYLTGAVAGGRESYYLDATTDGEPPGQWNGRAAEAFGLVGEVDHQDMEALHGNFIDPRDARFQDRKQWDEAARLGSAPRQFRSVDDRVAAFEKAHPGALPEDVAAARARAEKDVRSTVFFEDLTFGVPKSVTVLHAALAKQELEALQSGDGSAAGWAAKRLAVEEAVHAGNAAMLEYMSQRAGYARSGGDRSGHATHYLDAHDWSVASFFQHTNRDLEPHLHIHNATLNRVQVDDGRFLALDGKSLRHWKQAGGALAERVMQEQLARTLGLEFKLGKAGHTRDVVGVDAEVMELFSERTAKVTARSAVLIEAMQERLGRELTPLEHNRIRQQATLATRRAKTHQGETTEQMLERWHQQLKQELAGGLLRQALRFEDAGPAGPTLELVEFSPSTVIARALDAVQEKRATWTRPELIRQIDLALPDNLGGLAAGDIIALVERLTDTAIASQEVVQAAGRTLVAEVPAELQRADGTSVYDSPRSKRFVTRQHVLAEEALRRSAAERGLFALGRRDIDRWIGERSTLLGADQAAALRGITTSGVGLSVLVGPAGAGKSHAAGALAAAWEELGGGRVIGLAVSQVATEVLREDGVERAANTTAWLNAQARLEAGTPSPGDVDWALSDRDIVLVDEASMVGTQQLARIRLAAAAAGARVVLAGDPAQLGAVGAGGMMALLAAGEAETYSLSDVRRFDAGWERAASLRLRAGDDAALREYDRHARLVDGGTRDEAFDTAARMWVADRLRGRTSAIVVGSNDDAAELSARVRAQLVELGTVQEDGVVLGRDGTTAGVGDVIAARKIDWGLRVLNRRQYEVVSVGEDGGLTVASLTDGTLHDLPASYVSEHVSLGYAGTKHSVQGSTVASGIQLVDRRTSREGAYVGMTRGRESNVAVVVTIEETDLGTETGVRITDPVRRTPLAVFGDVLARDGAELSAAAVDEEDTALVAGADFIGAHIEDAVQTAARLRLDDALDELVADGVLGEGQRARLCADQGTVYLARVVRAAEQAGHDHQQVLRDAIGLAPLTGARSLAQLLSWRITTHTDLTQTSAAPVPVGLSEDMTDYLEKLHAAAAGRRAALGAQCIEEMPRWALAAFGAPPASSGPEGDAWAARAGLVAAHREASGWADETVPIGPAPGLQSTERRAAWHEAWDTLGQPAAQADEGDLSDGRLLNRVAAWEREQANAPAYVDDYLRATSTLVRSAQHDAAFAGALGQDDDATRLDNEAELGRATVGALDDAARERGLWLAASTATRESAVRAEAELETRGIKVGAEPDRISVEDYLLEVVQDDDGQVEIVQRPVAAAPAAVIPAAEVPTLGEAEQIRARAAWVAEVLSDRQSADEAWYGEDGAGWAIVDAESRAWELALGHEEAVISTDAVVDAV